MSDERWLALAPSMVGGIFECARNLESWKAWEWDETKSKGTNFDEVIGLHLDFFRSFDFIVAELNRWRDLPHPPIASARKRSRQWGVLNISFKCMTSAIGYEYTAFSLARYGNEEEVEIGSGAVGQGATLFKVMRLGLDQTISGRVDSLDGVMKWSHYVIGDRQQLEEFEEKYSDRAAELRFQAGLSHKI